MKKLSREKTVVPGANSELQSIPSHYQIAEITGFSRSTVSRALANHPLISDRTKTAINAAAKKLGYQPNPQIALRNAQIRQNRGARNLSVLGYITSFAWAGVEIPGEKSSPYAEYYAGAQAHAEELGYKLDVIWRLESSMPAARFNSILRARGIQGVLIAPRPRPLGHISMDYSRVAAVALGHPLPSPHISHSSPWHLQNMNLAIRVILKHGYKRLGFAIPPDADRYANFSYSSRFALYQTQIRKTQRVPMLASPEQKTHPSLEKFKSWFEKYRPEVILCTSTLIPKWIAELGLRVPNDVAYANLSLIDTKSEVSGVYERTRKIGACAVDLVVEQLHQNRHGVPDIPKSNLIEGEWVDGKTL